MMTETDLYDRIGDPEKSPGSVARGFQVYRGPSRIDGAPIICIATLRSRNAKTGPMIQTWILRDDRSPIDAVRSGADYSICGNCSARGDGGGFAERFCYVNVAQAPTEVYKAWQRGSYPVLDSRHIGWLVRGSKVRLGAYGDPAALPVSLVRRLAESSDGWTGYTHQWRRFSAYRHWLMASCDNPQDLADARRAGWRCFRIRFADDPLIGRECICPASDEGKARIGREIQCADCMLCQGRAVSAADVAIVVHGTAVHLRNATLTIGKTS